ncbi:MAG TPA: choice-of-anchor D domain-containing protein [Candidatus Kapabacteria bacterium]|nr:choice-of-anchor D domain-containing protein [Candidatus Kapabacteria bacterium]
MKKSIILILLLCYGVAMGQSLSLFDIEASSFPTIKGKFFAFDTSGNQITNLSPSDFELKEDGIARTIKSISCPAPKPPAALSSVLTIDVSGSMDGGNMNLAKKAASAWVEGLPLGKSECAISSFDHNNYLNQDFTTDKNRLLNAINNLQAMGGTDYDYGLLNPLAGGLLVTKTGKYKRVIVFLSDGMPSNKPRTAKIISEANKQNVTIYAVTLGMSCPQSLKSISTQTGGQWFENVSTVEQARQIYQKILLTAQGGDPCAIEWESKAVCSNQETNVELRLINSGISSSGSYLPPQSAFAQLKFEPNYIVFKNKEVNKSHDTTIKVTAINGDFNVTNITSNNSFYDINPKSFTLTNGQSTNLTITYQATDSVYSYTKFELINNLCPATLYSSGKYSKYKKQVTTLKVRHPNGGEVFVVGSDTVITWDGIPKDELVQLEYSTDQGQNWNYIDTARGLRYEWKQVPRPASNQCLVKVKQLSGSAGNGSLVRTLSGHSSGVNSVSFSPDGAYLASGSYAQIKLWRVSDGSLVRILSGHSSGVSSVSFSPDGEYLASGGADKTIKLWRVSDGSLVRTLSGHSSLVNSVSFSPDGEYLASGSNDKTIKLWRVSDGSLVRTLPGHRDVVNSVSFSPDGEYLASGSDDYTIKLWRVSDGSLVRTLSWYSYGVNSVSFSPDGEYFASGNNGKTIRLWRVSDGSLVRILSWYSTWVNSVSFSPDGEYLASGGRDATIRLWRVSDGSLVRTLSGHSNSVESVSFSPDGAYLASGSDDATVKLWAIDATPIQEDVSDNVFSIVEPQVASRDIDMGSCLVGSVKDSVITDFVRNTGTWKFRVDSIYFEGADAGAFSLVSGFPEYTVEPNNTKNCEFRFIPNRIGIHQATIVIITQSDTLRQSIRGEGVEEKLALENTIIDFGVVDLGKQKDTIQVATIKNTGSVPIMITGTEHGYPNDKDFSTIAGGGSFTLQLGDTKTMDLRFVPSDVGRTSGTLKFYYNGVGSPAIVQLFGEGIKKNLKIQASVDAFSDLVCESQATNEIELSNKNGSENLVIKAINLKGTNSNEFEITGTMPLTIEPDSTKKLTITFKPQTAGQKSVGIEILSNADPDSILTIPITVRKEVIDYTFANDTLDIGILCPNQTLDTNINISNNGTIPIGIIISGSSNIQLPLSKIIVDKNQKETISLQFKGLPDEGSFLENITFKDTVCNTEKIVYIKGEVLLPSIDADDIKIQSRVNSNKESKLSIRNTGVRQAEIIAISGINQPFELINATFPIIIDVGGVAELAIRYTANDTESDTNVVEIIYEPCNRVAVATILGLPFSALATLKTIELEGKPGDSIKVPIILQNEENLILAGITTIDVELTFNPTLLYPQNYPVTAIDDHTAKITIKDIPANKNVGEILGEVEFTVGLGNADSCDLILQNATTNGGQAEITLLNGKFTLLGVCREGGARLVNPNAKAGIMKIAPNPADNNLEIEISLIENGASELVLYNAMGEVVKTIIHSENLERGRHTIQLNTTELGTGQYFLQLRTPTYLENKIVKVVK